jgi:acyl-CoA hydrolase
MAIPSIKLIHFVKSEDLNHHGTLYAGRCVEWMVEAGLIAACDVTQSEAIVCMRINGLLFRKPVPKGTLVAIHSTVAYAGRTSLMSYVHVSNKITGEFIVDGFFTYVYVDDNGKAQPHGITITPETEEEIKVAEEAMNFVDK